MGNISHTTGNVGIGTASPLVPLDVRGSVRVDNSGSFEQSVAFSGSAGGWARGLYFYDSRATNTLNPVGVTGAIGMVGSGTSPVSIFIGHGDSPWSGTKSIHLLTNGNVGIGTDAPTVKLDVNGGVKAASLALTGKATSASTVSGDSGTTLVTKDYVDVNSNSGSRVGDVHIFGTDSYNHSGDLTIDNTPSGWSISATSVTPPANTTWFFTWIRMDVNANINFVTFSASGTTSVPGGNAGTNRFVAVCKRTA